MSFRYLYIPAARTAAFQTSFNKLITKHGNKHLAIVEAVIYAASK
jgi:hypothetical protein